MLELTDSERRNYRAILAAIGCLKCPRLKIIHGRNVNSYDCAGGGCAKAQAALEILRAAQAKREEAAHG